MKLKIAARFFILLAFLAVLFAPISIAQSAYGSPIQKEGYEISRSKVERDISRGDIFRDSFKVTNFKESQIRASVFPTEPVSEVIGMESSGVIITSKNSSDVYFTITGIELGRFVGEIVISGDINEKIVVNISVINESLTPEFFVVLEPTKKVFTLEDRLDFKVDVQKIIGENVRNVTFSYTIKSLIDNSSHFLGSETKDLIGSLQIRKRIEFPQELEEGFYVLDVVTGFENKTTTSSAEFEIRTPFWSILLFGFLPVWLLAVIIGTLATFIVAFIFVRRAIEKRKKYKMQLYTNTLPKKTERSLLLGKVAETNLKAYLDMDAFTTHGVVAGATGGGKSISAQVIIEEALLNKIAVVVFDPTAQWSGMLRKCDDKKMLSFYPKFGLKASDAKAFPGNIKQIKNERQKVDVMKYMNPGQIQIFALNKLTPPQIDTFVATVIASIFNSDPKEYPELRMMLVFDEVHRLLPKFGGSGKGFLQIERACREFRKWGFGVMLVSQVLSDFVGSIKANINTEVQMRTRDESDLNRIKTKYGEEFLQSLIKASVGVGMFSNPKYNKGKPYFVNFRPILHNTRRLSDKILEQYNGYTDSIEDLEDQIEQLDKEKVDTFDLKMELKLVKDKLMTGNFTVVDIYLEGLKPRIEKQWTSIGKKPKKRELLLVDASEVEASIKKAQEGRKEFDGGKDSSEGKEGEEGSPEGEKESESKEGKSEGKKEEEGKSEGENGEASGKDGTKEGEDGVESKEEKQEEKTTENKDKEGEKPKAEGEKKVEGKKEEASEKGVKKDASGKGVKKAEEKSKEKKEPTKEGEDKNGEKEVKEGAKKDWKR